MTAARAWARSACSAVCPGLPGRAANASNAPCFATRHTATTVDLSTPYFVAAWRWVACPDKIETHSSYFCDAASTYRFFRIPLTL